jgi:hypothetical protein
MRQYGAICPRDIDTQDQADMQSTGRADTSEINRDVMMGYWHHRSARPATLILCFFPRLPKHHGLRALQSSQRQKAQMVSAAGS